LSTFLTPKPSTTSYCKILLAIFGKNHSGRKSVQGVSAALRILKSSRLYQKSPTPATEKVPVK
jgi:hypothetical protein